MGIKLKWRAGASGLAVCVCLVPVCSVRATDHGIEAAKYAAVGGCVPSPLYAPKRSPIKVQVRGNSHYKVKNFIHPFASSSIARPSIKGRARTSAMDAGIYVLPSLASTIKLPDSVQQLPTTPDSACGPFPNGVRCVVALEGFPPKQTSLHPNGTLIEQSNEVVFWRVTLLCYDPTDLVDRSIER